MAQVPSTASASGSSTPQASSTLRGRGDHYAFLNAALSHLRNRPDDAAVVLQVCQSYIALGLIGPARDLLQGLSSGLQSEPQVRVLREQIAKMPSGRVAWGSLQARFDSNIARLYEKYPEMRQHDAVFRAVPRLYELYRTTDGNLHVATRPGNGSRRWVPDLCDVKRLLDNAELPHNPKALFCGPYLVAGDLQGALFDRVFGATQKMLLTFTPRIYVVETDAAALGITLYVTESIERFCHERTALFVGPDSVDQLARHFEHHPALTPPEFAVHLTTAGETLCNQVVAVLQPRTVVLEQKARTVREAVQRYYDALPSHHWRERFRPDRTEPLRVLGLTSRFTTYLQYSMRDWGAAFKSRGHVFRVLMEDNDHDLIPSARTLEVLEAFKPDLIVIIDHLRGEYDSAVPVNVPLVCWIQDLLPHLATRDAGRSLGPLDFYIATSPNTFVHQYGYPASQGMAWTMATDDRTFSNEPMTEDELAPYRCDVSYVSSHSTLPRDFHDERRSWFAGDACAQRLTDHLFEALSRSFVDRPHVALAGIPYMLEQVKEETGLVPASTETQQALLHSYIYPIAELMFRQSTLAWVADYCDRTGRKLCLYGNGWDTHPRFARYACGFADNGPQLRAIYQASTVNLQIVGTGAIHQRLLDGLAAGGFFLIRYTPTDMMHEPVRRYLTALRKYDPVLGREYAAGDVPDLVDAVEELCRLRGRDRKFDRITFPVVGSTSYETMEAMDFRRVAGAVFAEYGDVSFASAEALARLTDRFLFERDERRRISGSMRAAVVNAHSYGALVDDLLAFVYRRLAADSEPSTG